MSEEIPMSPMQKANKGYSSQGLFIMNVGIPAYVEHDLELFDLSRHAARESELNRIVLKDKIPKTK